MSHRKIVLKLLKPTRLRAYARVSREFNDNFKLKLRAKFPKNTLKAKFLGRNTGLHNDDFVKNTITIFETWEVIRFKRVKKKYA